MDNLGTVFYGKNSHLTSYLHKYKAPSSFTSTGSNVDFSTMGGSVKYPSKYSALGDSTSSLSILKTPSSILSSSALLTATRRYTSPLPSLSVSTTSDPYKQTPSPFSPGSTRASRFLEQNNPSNTVNGASSYEDMRRSSSASHSPALLSPEGGISSSSSRTLMNMFPRVSRSFFRYRHSISRPSLSAPSRRCGSADPEIYRRISLSRQIPNSSTSTITERTKSVSKSGSHSASYSNSRSSSMDRYTNGNDVDGGLLLQQSDTDFSHDTSLNSIRCRDSAAYQSSNPERGEDAANPVVEDAFATTQQYPSASVNELARNVASHQWESTALTEGTHIHKNGKQVNSEKMCSGDEAKTEPHYSNGCDEERGAPTKTCGTASLYMNSSRSMTILEPVHSNGCTSLVVKASARDEIIYTNGNSNAHFFHPPTTQNSATCNKQTTMSKTNPEVQITNGFVRLMSSGGVNGDCSSTERISSPSKSTRQKIRLVKLQNKYGAFKSWLTPEDEKTLARVRSQDVDALA